MRNLYKLMAVGVLLLSWAQARADEHDAKNFITVATGAVPSSGDSRIKIVERQLDAISAFCATTSKGGAIHDTLAKAHSLMRAQQPLLELLADFVRIASAQCSNFDDNTLISLYVLERNAGATHVATVMKLAKNPKALLAKWSSR